MELISIIMPAYNAERFIENSIISVLDQTYQNWELLIINDGSTDGTAGIAGNYAVVDTRVKLINQPNMRLGAARNTGIRNAKGSWIAFLDADDLWVPQKLEKQMAISNQFPDVGVIFSDGYIFNDDDLSTIAPYQIITGKIDGARMYKLQYQRNYIPVLAVVVKKYLVDKVGFQYQGEIKQGCEDWDYWIRLAACGATFYGMPEQLFYYRRHGQSMSANVITMHQAQLALFLKNYNANVFNGKETRSIFIPLINYLMVLLVHQNRKDEAIAMVAQCKPVLPAISKLYKLLLLFPGNISVKLFDIINRTYKKIKR